MKVVYHCSDVIARYQVIERLYDITPGVIKTVRLVRTRDGFDVFCDEVTDDIHHSITSNVANISWEVIR